jgi:hypothetical protein
MPTDIHDAEGARCGPRDEPMFNPYQCIDRFRVAPGFYPIVSVITDDNEVVRCWPPEDFDVYWSALTQDELDHLMALIVGFGDLDVAQVLATEARANGFDLAAPTIHPGWQPS